MKNEKKRLKKKVKQRSAGENGTYHSYGHWRDANGGVEDPQANPDTLQESAGMFHQVELPTRVLALMEESLASMSMRQRSCIELFYGIGGKGKLPQSKIAGELAITPAQVQTLIRNGLAHMRQFLKEHGVQG